MNPEIASQIQAEQNHGRQKYGGRPDNYRHDDSHEMEHWNDFIAGHVERLDHDGPEEWRQRLIKIAGLAVSAIESFDRKRNNR